jgi:hypothetical protein
VKRVAEAISQASEKLCEARGLKRRPLASRSIPPLKRHTFLLKGSAVTAICSVTFLNEATRRGVLIVAHQAGVYSECGNRSLFHSTKYFHLS